MTEILIKRLSDNVSLPKYETEGSSGMDLAANINKKIELTRHYSFSSQLAYQYLFQKILKFKSGQDQVWPQKTK